MNRKFSTDRATTHVIKPNEAETYHDQVGYCLWETATETVLHTLNIPRGQVALAMGKAAPDAVSFELVAARGSTENGFCSTRFLESAPYKAIAAAKKRGGTYRPDFRCAQFIAPLRRIARV